MRNTGLRLAVVVAALFAALTGFVFTGTADEATIPGSGSVIVRGQTATTGGIGLPELVQQAADESGAVVVRRTRDLNDSAIRHFYVVLDDAGRAEARWLTEGYPSFNTGIQTVVHPVSNLQGLDPRGHYFVLGPPLIVSTISGPSRAKIFGPTL